jgi:hypothetical protein
MIELDTLIVMIYVFVDDWYREHIAPVKPNRGRPCQFSDSEALTIAIVSEWRAGVSWQSERGCLRYLHQHYGSWFPHLPQRSAFNERKRFLLGVLNHLNQSLAAFLTSDEDVYECVDSLPIPAGTLGQYSRDQGHWLWNSTIGRGKGGWFWGDHMLASVCPSGVITGWMVAAAHINDRWLLEAFLSTRHGSGYMIGPPHRIRAGYQSQTWPPIGFMGAQFAIGADRKRPYLADQGFNGLRWQQHWLKQFSACVISVPPDHSREERPWRADEKHWLASHRQIVETVFATLTRVFDIKRLVAHSRWGQYTRITAKLVAYHFGLCINHSLGRHAQSHETLLC